MHKYPIMPLKGKKKYARRKPARKPGRKYTRKSVYKKKGSKSSGYISSFGASDPFPVNLSRTLTYSQPVVSLTQSLTAIPTYNEYRGNSCYDPDLSGAGNQPRYYDTLCGATGGTAPYARYCVYASRIRVTVYPNTGLSTATNSMGTVFIQPVIGTTTNQPASMQDIMEMPWIKSRECMGGNINPSQPFTMTHFMKTKTIWGCKDIEDSDDYQAEYNNNPLNQWRWVVGICNNVTAGIFAAYIKVEIKYYVKFLKPNLVAIS